MTLFLSHKLEHLVDCLAERLQNESAPLLESWILVPGLINHEWLLAELAERMEGRAVAGLKILPWRRALLAHSPAAPDPFALPLALAKIFHDSSADNDLAPIQSWLEAGPSRMPVLCRRLSRQIMEGAFGKPPAVPWQRRLSQLLEQNYGWRLPLPVQKIPVDLPIHCFCIDDMPWDFLPAGPNLSIYLFSPCQMYWEDLVSDKDRGRLARRWRGQKIAPASLDAIENYLRDTHPLLANWGKLGRKTIRQLEEKPLTVVEAYGEDKAPRSLLEFLQRDILFLRSRNDPAERIESDDSFAIHAAGASRLREMQILKDRILHLLTLRQMRPSDILVLAPDIGQYEPLVPFVFGQDVPWRIAPAPMLPRNAFLNGLLLFFQLIDRSFDADLVMELFENKSFMSKNQLNGEDCGQFRIWLEEAKVRGGWGGRGGWEPGLQRMVRGLVYLLPGDNPLPRIQSVSWGQAELLGRLISLMRQLQKLAQKWQESRTLEEWAALLNELGQLFDAKESDDEVLRTFLHKMVRAIPVFPKDPFPSSLVRGMLEDDCRAATTADHQHQIEAVQFGSLQPGAIRPARAVLLIGFDSESFPWNKPPSTIDWESAPEDRDRYLLLEALMAARDHFSVSYCHRSSHDGKPVDLAWPIQELCQVIDEFYPQASGKTFAACTALHPSLPYDPRYFQKGSPLLSYSQEAFRAAGAPPAALPIFWPDCQSLPSSEGRVFDLADLTLLSRNPWKYFLRKSLGIYRKDESLFSDLRLEDMALPAYHEQKLLKLALEEPIDDVIARHSDELPAGGFGEWAAAQLRKKANEWNGHLQKWGIDHKNIFTIHLAPDCLERRDAGQRVDAPPIVLKNGTIVGKIDLATPLGLLMSDEPNFSGYLRHWPALLAYLHLYPSSAALFSCKKGSRKSWAEIDAGEALSRWVDYAIRAEKKLSPLIAPWADAFLRKSKDEWKRDAQKLLAEDEDATLQWVGERAQPLPLDSIWEEWSGFLQETLADFVKERGKEDAVL